MSLKQKLAISLCTFYLVSVIGVAMSLHFCGGKLAAISTSNTQAACKSCKSTPLTQKKNNCCKNTKIDVKVKESHQIQSAVELPKFFSVDVIIPRAFHFVFQYFLPSLFNKLENKAPPKANGVALHVMNCVFRN